MNCTACGIEAAPPFSQGGVCLRCLGERVLAPPQPLRGGWSIGPYELIEELGRGGMGCVYAAQQVGLGRIVALKALAEKSGASASLQLRFLREAQTVARLRHPNIVAVYESGQADGYAYFSMEYIEGGDLAARLRSGPFAPLAAATLVQKLAGALAYAHTQGVLHRDLKPSNVLMDEEEPKLADFGLAAELDATSGITVVTTVLGTPHYLAPEALTQGSGALTAQSDIYGVGVILFELLTGRTPFSGASPAELPALATTHDPPAPRLLAPATPRDLETICLKCLEREPRRRYASAAAVAEDLRRFLSGEPILARRPGPIYTAVKYARRHRAGVAAATSAAAVLIVATIVSSSLAIRATRAEKRSAASAAESQAVRDFLENDLLAQAAPSNQPDRNVSLRTVLDRAAQRIDGKFAGQPDAEASLRLILGSTYEDLGAPDIAETHYRRSLSLRESIGGPDDAKALVAGSQLVSALAEQLKLPEAEKLGYALLERSRRVLGSDNTQTFELMNYLIYVLKAQGKLADAEKMGREVLDLSLRAHGPRDEQTRNAMSNLSSVYFAEDKYAEAEALNERALKLEQEVLGPEKPETLVVMSNLASVYWAENKLAQAEAINRRILDIRRKLLGPEHRETLRSMNSLGTTLTEEGRYAEAADMERQAYELRKKVLGADHADTISAESNLAGALGELGRKEEALAVARDALARADRVEGPNHFNTLGSLSILSVNEQMLGELPAAEAHAREIIRRRTAGGMPANIGAAFAADRLGWVLLDEGKLAEAESVLREAVGIYRRVNPDHWRHFAAESRLGECLWAQGKRDEGRRELELGFQGLVARKDRIPARYTRIYHTAELAWSQAQPARTAAAP